MLVNLHVKNFAIIDEIDIDFGKHLNILTGETGAGKSIIIGSISIALGARVSPEIIGRNGEYAMVEAVFHVENEKTLKKLRALDIDMEDGEIVISRKITESRSVNKINGESVSVGVIKQVAALCIDIHGQHEHQSLLNQEKHLEIVDEFGGEELARASEQVAELYAIYSNLKKELADSDISDEERARQKSFLEYEKEEIEQANLTRNEMDSIEDEFRLASHAGVIVEKLSDVYDNCSHRAASEISRALQQMQEVAEFNEELRNFNEELIQIEELLSDFNRGISGYMSDFSFDEKELNRLQNRLDLIGNMRTKYGETYEEIVQYLDDVNAKLAQFEDYEAYRQEKMNELRQLEEKLTARCEELTELRAKAAKTLEQKITEALQELNFAHVDFSIEFHQKETPTAKGMEEIEFMIATNPGEPRRSLAKVASGGELSRIMLAIKSVFADNDEIETLIFDEIDTGISGRTAQMVSEKMAMLGRKHQILCITHLPQIAAMSDTHFVIEKEVNEDRSTTRIRPLNENEVEEELARLLGGVEITDAVRTSAKEMKELAQQAKKYK